MRPEIDNFFFDLDGTLVDSLAGIEYSVRSATGGSIPPLRPRIGPPIEAILRGIRPGATEAEVETLTLRFRAAYDSAGWRMTVLQEGAAEVLAALRNRGKHLFLVTNKPSAATGKILELLDIGGYFVEVVARDSRHPVFHSKAEMLELILDRHGLDRKRSLMVGDTAEDYGAAVSAGMPAAIVGNGYGTAADVPPESRLQNLGGLFSFLGGAGNPLYGAAACVNPNGAAPCAPAAGGEGI